MKTLHFLAAWALALAQPLCAQESELDTSFGGAPHPGVRAIPFDAPASTLEDRGSLIAAIPSGGFIVAGMVTTASGGVDIGVTRLTDTGSIDASFGDAGKKVIPVDIVQAGFDRPTSMALDSTGRIVIGAAVQGTGSGQAVVIRLTPQGQPDASFAPGGVHLLSSGFGYTTTGSSAEVVVGPNDAIFFGIVVRPDNGSIGEYLFGRIGANGVRDATFGPQGRYLLPTPGGSAVSMNDLAIKGQLLVSCGGATVGSNARWLFAQIPLDAGINNNVSLINAGETSVDVGRHVCHALSPSAHHISRVYLAGNAKVGGVVNTVVAAVDLFGQLDFSWSGDGLARFVFPNQLDTRAHAIVERATGDVLVGGSLEFASTGWDAFAAQLLPQGALDGAFSPAGYRVYDGVLNDAREEHFADVVESRGRPAFAGSMQFAGVAQTDHDFAVTALVRELDIFSAGFE